MLRLSIAATAFVAVPGIGFGLITGSFSIMFDGVYSLVDGIMTAAALLVANLIAASASAGAESRRLVQRFTMGFWHLELMVLGVKGVLLTGAAIYAFITAIGVLLARGRELQFDRAILYGVLTLTVCLCMELLGLRANRKLRSDVVALDAKGWLMSGAITASLLVAFFGGFAVQDTSLSWISPYIDPAVLALVCLVIIPIPIGTIRRSLADILLITPTDLKAQVDDVAHGSSRSTALSIIVPMSPG